MAVLGAGVLATSWAAPVGAAPGDSPVELKLTVEAVGIDEGATWRTEVSLDHGAAEPVKEELTAVGAAQASTSFPDLDPGKVSLSLSEGTLTCKQPDLDPFGKGYQVDLATTASLTCRVADLVGEAPADAARMAASEPDAPAEEPAKEEQKSEAPAQEPAKEEQKSEAPAQEPAKEEQKSEALAQEPAKGEQKSEAPAEEPAKGEQKSEAPAEEPAKDGQKSEAPAKDQAKDEPTNGESAKDEKADAKELPEGLPKECYDESMSDEERQRLEIDCSGEERGMAAQRAVPPSTVQNPPLPPSCAIDVMMVVDESGSIAQANAEGQMKTAMNSLFSALSNTGSTMAITSFSTFGNSEVSFTPVDSASIATTGPLGGYANSYSAFGGTNWQDGLREAREVQPADGTTELVLFLTDGEPNYYGDAPPVQGPGNGYDVTARNLAVTQADAIKTAGSHMFVVGIGNVREGNLQTVSGDVRFPDDGAPFGSSDYAVVPNFDDLESALRAAVYAQCAPEVIVNKRVDTDGDGDYETPGQGFEFEAEISDINTDGGVVDWVRPDAADNATPVTQSTGTNGSAQFEWRFGSQDAPQPGQLDMRIEETPRPGYTYMGATCEARLLAADGTLVTTDLGRFAAGDPITLNDIQERTIIECTAENRADTRVVLQKQWADAIADDKATLTIEGGGETTSDTSTAPDAPTVDDSDADDAPDADNSAELSVPTGTAVTLTESLGGNDGNYTATLACVDGSGNPYTVSYDATARQGEIDTTNAAGQTITCTFENTLQRFDVTLTKEWVDGAEGDTAGLTINDGPTGDDAVESVVGEETAAQATVPVSFGDPVSVAELLGEDNAGSYDTSLSCEGTDVDYEAGDLEGQFTMPANDVACTFTNERRQAGVTLTKEWVDAFTGDTAGLTINDGPTGDDAVVSEVGADPASVTVPVSSGDPVTVAELLGSDNTGTYDTTLACEGVDPSYTAGSLSGTFTMPDNPVRCAFANTARGEYTYAKSVDVGDGATVQPGDTLVYTVTATHTGGTRVDDVVISDDLSDVLDNATIGTITAPEGTTAELADDGETLTWTIPALSPDEELTLTYEVTVDDDQWGETLRNAVTSTGGECEEDCDTENPVPSYVLEKSADAADGEQVEPGDSVTYTLRATNDSDAVLSGRSVTDDLTDVLDNASFDEGSLSYGEVTDGSQAVLDGETLTWTLPRLAPGESATVSYTVTVKADQWGESLRNVATPGDDDGGECVEDCDTEHPVPSYTLSKSSDPADGSSVEPGDSVTYTVRATNDSDAVLSGRSVTDDLTDVLDNASFDDGSISYGEVTDGSAAVRDGSTLTWTLPRLAPGESATVSYTVTVKADQWGESLRNVATPGDDDGGECVEDCDTEHPVPSYTLSKSSDPADGSSVEPGDSVTYTVRATNDSDAVLSGRSVTDDLTDVLDNASFDDGSISYGEVTDGSAAVRDGSTLTWTLPRLAPGESATVSYTVRVKADQWGESLRNVATAGDDDGGECVEDCDTEHPTPEKPKPEEPTPPKPEEPTPPKPEEPTPTHPTPTHPAPTHPAPTVPTGELEVGGLPVWTVTLGMLLVLLGGAGAFVAARSGRRGTHRHE
ncbi:isopeptide-forming domain-containing fimbrial protein [Marihabitans asiaticum]|uniref:DUF7927 domain-containing protein n=1 Tax=Marihabitans asiaticum TaxID=415218 RepID=UPI0011A23D21|nr:isopeptide-forming domain-containing fimbrial protein [Marihabitans asiaticum]